MKLQFWKPIAIGVVTAVLHLGITGYFLSKSSSTRVLEAIFSVISFPLVYVDRLSAHGVSPKLLGFDWLPVLVVGNSVLWGAAFAVLWIWWARSHASEKPADA